MNFHGKTIGRRFFSAGYSLMELLIVVTIIGLLLAISIPQYKKFQERAKVTATRSTLRSLQIALSEYAEDMGHYPTKREGGLLALMVPPEDETAAKSWNGPYLENRSGKRYAVPLDPWKDPYVYHSAADEELVFPREYHEYEVFSYGGDKTRSDKRKWIHVGE